MNVLGKYLMDKFLPEAKRFQQEKAKRENEQKIQRFLASGMEDIKETQREQYVGSLFNFLDEGKFKKKYQEAEAKFGISKKDLMKGGGHHHNQHKNLMMDISVGTRYIIVHKTDHGKKPAMNYAEFTASKAA